MRMAQARARYTARVPRPGEALLVWSAHHTGATEDRLYPTLTAALAAAAGMRVGGCAVWVYDGRRLYDAGAITSILAARDAPWPDERDGALADDHGGATAVG